MKKIKKEILDFMIERNWNDTPPADVAKSIVIEAAELLENFQWKNHSREDIKIDYEKKKRISYELADVLIYCINLAILLDVEPTDIIREKLELARKKYPANIVKNEERGGKKYLEIKKKHRNNK